MLLTLTTTTAPARDLGFLLHKHPDAVFARDTSFGTAHVFWPEATDERATCALLLEVDPVSLVRGRPDAIGSGPLGQYVNDRPYVASSFLSVALNTAFRSALAGQCAQPELVDLPRELAAHLPALPCRGGAALLRRLFEPLGYTVHAERLPLDETVPAWGDSSVHTVTLTATTTVRALLNHLYVLIPVLDHDKHYWVGQAEVDKLLAKGGDWLPEHPERELIAQRYLRFRRLAERAIASWVEESEAPEPADTGEEAIEARISLNEHRIRDVTAALEGCARVLDLGCGEGKLLVRLARQATEVVGVDVSATSLERAESRLERIRDSHRQRVTLLHSSLVCRDSRLVGFDGAALVEVIEHVDADRLPALEDAVFGHAAPGRVVVTTPNIEYNAKFEGLTGLRHTDHRWEWTRAEFAAWCDRIAATYGYTVTLAPVGEVDPELGAPTQMGVFTR